MSAEQPPTGHTEEHTGVVAVVDEVKERFTREWDSLKHRAQEVFAKLTADDLDSVKGRFDELRHRVVAAYGYAEERAHEEVSKLLHGGSTVAGGGPTPETPVVRATEVKQPGKKKPRGARRHAKAPKNAAD